MLNECGHDAFGHLDFSRNRADDPAVKYHGHALGFGGFHLIDDGLRLVFEILVGELDDLWMTFFQHHRNRAVFFLGDAVDILGKLEMGIKQTPPLIEPP